MTATTPTKQKIREAVVAALKAASLPGVGDNVFASRTTKSWPSEGAFICVYTNDSNFDNGTQSCTNYKVDTELSIEIHCRNVAYQKTENGVVEVSIDDQMDILSDLVLKTLFYDGMNMNKALNIDVDNYITVKSVNNTFGGESGEIIGSAVVGLTVTWWCEIVSGECETECRSIYNELNVRDGEDSKKITWIYSLEADDNES